MTVRISAIIPVYRDWERLALCLEALGRQTLPLEDFEIIVVNNEPQPRELPAGSPGNARIVHEPRAGSYHARNRAVAGSRGRTLAFTDSDCIPDPQWLENGLAALERQPGTRIAGAVSIFRQPGTAYPAYLYDLHMAFRQRENVLSFGVCVTANLIVDRETFDRVGLFGTRFSGEDYAWNLRAHSLGVPIAYEEGVRVAHPARQTIGEIFTKRRRTVGAQSQQAAAYRFILGRLRPPVRHVRRLRRNGVGWSEVLIVAALDWFGGLVDIQEFSLVRLGLKQPNRS